MLRPHLVTVTFAVLLVARPASAQDPRQLATLPPAAVETLRQEMRDNLITLNEIQRLVIEGKVKEAGAIAEKKLGTGAMGQHRDKPLDARPGLRLLSSRWACRASAVMPARARVCAQVLDNPQRPRRPLRSRPPCGPPRAAAVPIGFTLGAGFSGLFFLSLSPRCSARRR